MFEPGTNILTEQAREANRLRHELGLTQEAQWIATRERDAALAEVERLRAALNYYGMRFDGGRLARETLRTVGVETEDGGTSG